MLGCGRASTSAMRMRMDRSWDGRSPRFWSHTSSSRSAQQSCLPEHQRSFCCAVCCVRRVAVSTDRAAPAESSSAAKSAWEHVGPASQASWHRSPRIRPPAERSTSRRWRAVSGDRSTAGETWATVNNGMATLATSALAVDAAGPQTVYVGTVGGGACESRDDGGESWHALAGGIQGLIVHPLVADPVHIRASWFAGTLGGSMRKTVDGGNTAGGVHWYEASSASRSTPTTPKSSISERSNRRVQEQQCRLFVDRDVHSRHV